MGFVFCVCFVVRCWVIFYSFFWPLCSLSFFDQRILITPLLSSNSSYDLQVYHLLIYDPSMYIGKHGKMKNTQVLLFFSSPPSTVYLTKKFNHTYDWIYMKCGLSIFKISIFFTTSLYIYSLLSKWIVLNTETLTS